MIAGYRVSSTIVNASSSDLAKPPCGTARPIRLIASANCSRSSAMRIERSFAPINSTPYLSNTPCSWRSIARVRAVCPPIVGRIASGFSFSTIRVTHSLVSGSM